MDLSASGGDVAGDRLRRAAALLDAELYAMLDDGIDPLRDISAPLARLLRELADGPRDRVDGAADALAVAVAGAYDAPLDEPGTRGWVGIDAVAVCAWLLAEARWQRDVALWLRAEDTWALSLQHVRITKPFPHWIYAFSATSPRVTYLTGNGS